jgi:hypothetical protein
MNIRPDEALKKLRPEIILPEREPLGLELFQNQVLRPILKFQHPLLVLHFEAEVSKHFGLNRFQLLNTEEKKVYLKQLISGAFRSQLIGQITGLFTLEEWESYAQNRKEYDKRLVQMLSQRLLSNYLGIC